MTPIRKTLLVKETLRVEAGRPVSRPIIRVAAIAVIENPFAGRFVEDLSPLFDVSVQLGEMLMPQAVALLEAAPRSYGKSAIVGLDGDIEHAAALLHPALGKPMRAAIGGGEAIIPSSSKVACAGTPIDVPIGNKDDVWSFDDFDTMTVMVPDAPRANEVVLIMAVTDAGRPHPRVGSGRAVT